MAISVLDTLVTRLVFAGDTSQLSKIERRVDQTKQKLNDFSRTAAVAGTVITGALAGTVKSALDLEKNWSFVAASTGKSVKALKEQYGDFVRSLSNETATSQVDIQNALQKTISAGVEGAAAMDLVTEAAKVQKLGIGNANDVVSTATTLMATYGVSAKEAVADVVKSGQLGEGDIVEFGPTLKTLALMGSAAGLTSDTTAGLAAIMSRVAPSVSEGGTAMRQFIRTILAGLPRTTKAFDEFGAEVGMTFEQAQEQTKAFDAIGASMGITWEDVQKKLTSNDFIGALDLLEAVVGTDPTKWAKVFRDESAFSAFSGLMAQRDDLPAMFQEFEKGGDVVADAWIDYVDNNPSFVFEQIIENLKNFIALVGAYAIPDVLKLVAALKEFGGGVGWTEEQMARWGSRVLLLGPVLLLLAVALKATAILLGPMIALFKGLTIAVAWFGRTTGAVTVVQNLWNASMAWTRRLAIGTRIQLAYLWVQQRLMQAATLLAAGAQWAFNAALMANPIGMIIGLIALLVAAIVGAVVYWDEITAAVQRFWGWLRQVFADAPLWVDALVVALGFVLGPIGGIIAAVLVLRKHWDGITSAVDRLVQAILDKLGPLGDWLREKFPMLFGDSETKAELEVERVVREARIAEGEADRLDAEAAAYEAEGGRKAVVDQMRYEADMFRRQADQLRAQVPEAAPTAPVELSEGPQPPVEATFPAEGGPGAGETLAAADGASTALEPPAVIDVPGVGEVPLPEIASVEVESPPEARFGVPPEVGVEQLQEAGFGVAPEVGFGVAPEAGFGVPPEAGFGVPPEAGFGVPPEAGFGVPPEAGFGVPPEAGFGVAPEAGFGVPPEAGFGVPPEAGFGVAPEAGFGVPPEAGFGVAPEAGFGVAPEAGFGVAPEAGFGVAPEAGFGVAPEAGFGVAPEAGFGVAPEAGFGVAPEAGFGVPPEAGFGVPPEAGFGVPPEAGFGVAPEVGVTDPGIPVPEAAPYALQELVPAAPGRTISIQQGDVNITVPPGTQDEMLNEIASSVDRAVRDANRMAAESWDNAIAE